MRGLLLALGLLASLAIPASAQFNASLFKGGSGSSGPPAVTLIGSGTNPDSVSTPITISATVPAGALIVCAAGGGYYSGAAWSASDTASNTYHQILYQKMAVNTVGLLFYSYNSTAMSGGTITINVTGHNAGGQITATCVYAIGIQTSSDPHDATVDATSAPTSATSTSITGANAPAVAGSLQIAYIACYHNSTTATLTGAGSPWIAFPNYPGTSSSPVVAGYQVSSSKLTYSATWGGPNTDYANGITAFKP